MENEKFRIRRFAFSLNSFFSSFFCRTFFQLFLSRDIRIIFFIYKLIRKIKEINTSSDETKENAFISLFCLRLLKFYPFKEIFIFAYNYYFVKRLLGNLLRIFVETNDTPRRIMRYEEEIS